MVLHLDTLNPKQYILDAHVCVLLCACVCFSLNCICPDTLHAVHIKVKLFSSTI